VWQATEIYTREFDARLRSLPRQLQTRLEAHIRDLGRRLESFPHQRLQGRSEYRLRVGDYRVIYRFDVEANELLLITLGHRREVYRV
jgi:mRNA interferase RelE/StbE